MSEVFLGMCGLRWVWGYGWIMIECQLGNWKVVKGDLQLIYPPLYLHIGIGSRFCMSQLVIGKAFSAEVGVHSLPCR